MNPVLVCSNNKPVVAEKLRSQRTVKWGDSNVHCCIYASIVDDLFGQTGTTTRGIQVGRGVMDWEELATVESDCYWTLMKGPCLCSRTAVVLA